MDQTKESLICSLSSLPLEFELSVECDLGLQYSKRSARVLFCFMFLLTERKRSMESERLQAKVCVGGVTVYCWVCCLVSFFLHIMHFVARTPVLIWNARTNYASYPFSDGVETYLITFLSLSASYTYMCTHFFCFEYVCLCTLLRQFTLVWHRAHLTWEKKG